MTFSAVFSRGTGPGGGDATLFNQQAILAQLAAIEVSVDLIPSVLQKLDSIELTDRVDYSIQIRTASNSPIYGVNCWVATDAAGENLVSGVVVSNNRGIVRFLLSPGNYFLFRQRNGLTFVNPRPFTVPE